MKALMILPLVAVSASALAAPPSPIGRWANPRHTIEVATSGCGTGRLCGAIVWAAPAATADAHAAGVNALIGTQLLRDYRRSGDGEWNGRVYVPDMGRTFASHISQATPDTLTIAGCLFGHWFCKSQTWRRVG